MKKFCRVVGVVCMVFPPLAAVIAAIYRVDFDGTRLAVWMAVGFYLLVVASIIEAIDRVAEAVEHKAKWVRWTLKREGQKSRRAYQEATQAKDDSAMPARQLSAVARPVEKRKASYKGTGRDR
jgi:hypothetical protein